MFGNKVPKSGVDMMKAKTKEQDSELFKQAQELNKFKLVVDDLKYNMKGEG